MNFNQVINIIKGHQKGCESVSLEYEIDGVSCKICITTNKIIKRDKELYGAEINIFNNTIDYTLINYGSNTVENKFYEEYNNEIINDLVKTTIDKLKDCS